MKLQFAHRCVVLGVGVTLTFIHALAASGLAPKWWVTDSGGDTTTLLRNENAYAQPLANLPQEQLRQFTFGNRLFNTNWTIAPSSVDKFDGLGPLFNRVSCSACHTRDGRGQPPNAADDTLDSMLIRLSIPGHDAHDGNLPVPNYGDQFNERSIPGVPAEGHTRVTYLTVDGQYPDGTHYQLLSPQYQLTDLGYGPLPADVLISPRVAPPVFGLGLLEAVPEEALQQLADPDDANHDGISGRMNRVWDEASQQLRIGRFGWKANQPSLRQQNAAAARGDIGITTRLFSTENTMPGQAHAMHAASGGSPEMSDEYLDKLTMYTRTLAPPAARADDPETFRGAHLFHKIGCAACHTTTLRTGIVGDLPALSNQTIHPYTDLLLHDMGAALADGRSDFAASGNEWRTPPLWGIGLTVTVNRHTRFLHDGRARSLEEAILWHGGEAGDAQSRFVQLTPAQRSALLAFLDSL